MTPRLQQLVASYLDSGYTLQSFLRQSSTRVSRQTVTTMQQYLQTLHAYPGLSRNGRGVAYYSSAIKAKASYRMAMAKLEQNPAFDPCSSLAQSRPFVHQATRSLHLDLMQKQDRITIPSSLTTRFPLAY